MNPPQAPSPHRRRRTKNPRPLGAFLFLLGGLLLYVCEIMPMLDAQQHRPNLGGSFSGKGTIAGFAFFVFGLAFLIGGRPVLRFFNPDSEKSKVPACIIAGIAVGGGVVLSIWSKAYLESLGYSFQYWNGYRN